MFRFKNTLLVNIKEYGISVFKYKKVEYYPADKFDAECGKHCKHL